MSRITITFTDVEVPQDDGTTNSGVMMDVDSDITEEDAGMIATPAQLISVTIKRMFEKGQFAKIVPVVCADMRGEQPVRQHNVEAAVPDDPETLPGLPSPAPDEQS